MSTRSGQTWQSGHRTDDPAGIVIDAALPRNGVERRHMPALPYDEVADARSTPSA